MRKNITLILLFIISLSVNCQQVYLELGKTLSSFDYSNSKGEKLANLQASSNSFLSIGFRDNLPLDKLSASLGLIYTGYGAIGSDDVVGDFMEWDVNYLELVGGLDFEIYNFKKTSAYVKTTSKASFFLQGTQTLNASVINLKSSNEFNKILLSLNVGFGVAQHVSDNLILFAEYMYGKTLNNSSNRENLKIINKALSFGVLIDIQK